MNTLTAALWHGHLRLPQQIKSAATGTFVGFLLLWKPWSAVEGPRICCSEIGCIPARFHGEGKLDVVLFSAV